jgi:hypothetical protein
MNVKGEQYSLEVIISVIREGQDMQAADERCFTIYAELETMVHADKTISGAVASASVAGFELGEYVTDSNRESMLTVQIAVETWLF